MSEAKQVQWAKELDVRAGHVAKTVLDKFEHLAREQLKPEQRKELHASIAETILQAMYKLGTFVCAGAHESIAVTIESIAIKGQDPKDTKIMLVPGLSPNFLNLLAANAKKDAVLAFVNQTAYSQAREELVRDIHRDQTDWVHQSEKQAAVRQPGDTEPKPLIVVDSLAQEDTLHGKLVDIGVDVTREFVASFTDPQRAISWEWALQYEKEAEDGTPMTMARPPWLPIPIFNNSNEENSGGTNETTQEPVASSGGGAENDVGGNSGNAGAAEGAETVAADAGAAASDGAGAGGGQDAAGEDRQAGAGGSDGGASSDDDGGEPVVPAAAARKSNRKPTRGAGARA
jgi:hypothetical protein